MARFTSENAAEHGRCGGRQSHQRSKEQYAALVLTNPSAAERVAHLIQQGHRLGLALRVIKISDRLNRGGR
jgi:uroporphyrinogen-III synthase